MCDRTQVTERIQLLKAFDLQGVFERKDDLYTERHLSERNILLSYMLCAPRPSLDLAPPSVLAPPGTLRPNHLPIVRS